MSYRMPCRPSLLKPVKVGEEREMTTEETGKEGYTLPKEPNVIYIGRKPPMSYVRRSYAPRAQTLLIRVLYRRERPHVF